MRGRVGRDDRCLAHVIERANVGMVQGRDAPGFTVEPLEELWIRSKPRGQDLDGHDAIQAAVAGFVDLAHAPGTEGRVDPIGTEERTGGKRMLEDVRHGVVVHQQLTRPHAARRIGTTGLQEERSSVSHVFARRQSRVAVSGEIFKTVEDGFTELDSEFVIDYAYGERVRIFRATLMWMSEHPHHHREGPVTRRQHVLLFLAVVLLGLVLQSDYSWRMAWDQGTVVYTRA